MNSCPCELVGELSNDPIETGNYNRLEHKPTINGVELIGDKTNEEIGIHIPTKNSELENDRNFITVSGATQLVNNEKTERVKSVNELDTKLNENVTNLGNKISTNRTEALNEIEALKARLDEYDKCQFLILE